MLDSKRLTRTAPQESSDHPRRDVKLSYEEIFIGVWRVLFVKDPPSSLSMFTFRLENFSSTFPLLCRAIYDLYIISPRSFAFHVVEQLWSAIDAPLSLYLSNAVFFSIEKKILGGSSDDQASLYWAVMRRAACAVFSVYVRWLTRRNRETYCSRVKYEFQARLFAANLTCDLPTSEELPSYVDIGSVYRCLSEVTMLLNSIISFLLHLRLIIHVIGKGLDDGGPLFIALSMFPPLVRQLQSRNFWSRGCVVNAANKFFIRKSALAKFTEPVLRQETVAGGISKMLINEYYNAKEGLGDTPDIPPNMVYMQHNTPLDTILSLCPSGSTLYFLLLALTSKSNMSIAELAALNQTSTSLDSTFSRISWTIRYFPTMFSEVENVYAVLDTKNKMKDGETLFPRPGYEASAGMSIELSDVSFSYPNSKSERDALSGITFSIQPGQLVVIVGANGSGKSTIIKLLSRLYDRTSGSIRIDGIPIEEYKMDELRKGIAVLTQEHQLFPLSLEENIKFGAAEAEAMDDREKILKSAVMAGADGIVKNFSSGYDTMLEPVDGYVIYGGRGDKELEAMQKELEKSTSISGGEKQRIVAARTFMRLLTSPVKLVTVDEPSSALDPEAEHRLFSNLRQERKGRTMVFVTHRFGHLTKHADLIICMKEGSVVEIGTHAELLAKEGEYSRLYNVQAQAFTTT